MPINDLQPTFKMTQEQMATRTGKDRASVANFLRLLRLPEVVQNQVEAGTLTFGHARTLLASPPPPKPSQPPPKSPAKPLACPSARPRPTSRTSSIPERQTKSNQIPQVLQQDPNVHEAQQTLQRALGLKVKIEDKKGKGRVIIEYSGIEDFDAILAALRSRQMNYLQASATEFRYPLLDPRPRLHPRLLVPVGRSYPTREALSPDISPPGWPSPPKAARAHDHHFLHRDRHHRLLLLGISLRRRRCRALRTWGPLASVPSPSPTPHMQAATVVAEGPYRHVRNPLYLGTWLHSLALALAHAPHRRASLHRPRHDPILQARLIAGEEPFLTASLRPRLHRILRTSSHASCHPSLHAPPPLGEKPHWLQADRRRVLHDPRRPWPLLTLGWRYNAFLLIQVRRHRLRRLHHRPPRRPDPPVYEQRRSQRAKSPPRTLSI